MCLARSHAPLISKVLADKTADQIRQSGVRSHECNRRSLHSNLNNPGNTERTARNCAVRYSITESSFYTNINNTKKQENTGGTTSNIAYVFENMFGLSCLGVLTEFIRKTIDDLRIDLVTAKPGKQLLAAGKL